MYNCPLSAPKQTSARIDFLRQSERLVEKMALTMLKFLLKVRQNNYAAYTREWATAQRTRALATASASGYRACCPRPTETTPCKRRSNLPLAARLSTCSERMEQLPPGRLLKHSHVLPQTNGAAFLVLSYLCPETSYMSGVSILVLQYKDINFSQVVEIFKVKTTSMTIET